MFDVAGVADPRGLDPPALATLLIELDRQRRAIEAALVAVIAEADRTGAHRADGHATVAGWCRALTRWSNGEATRRQQLAALAGSCDAVADALADGRLGVAQSHELARAAANPRCGDRLPDVATTLIEQTQRWSHHEFRAVVDRWMMLTDIDGAHRDADWSHERREASIVEVGGGVDVRASDGAVAGAILREVFSRFCDTEFAVDWDATVEKHGDAASPNVMPRTDRQRRFDALVAIFDRAAAQSPEAVSADPLVNVVVDLHTLEQLLTSEPTTPVPARRSCETSDGDLLAPADVLGALWWGRLRRVVVDTAGVVVDVGRRRRVFTGPAREAVLLQSRRCVWPGCDRPSGRCQADHIREWHDHGPTAVDNGAPLCSRHNRWKSRGYVTWRDGDGIWHTRRPDGTEM